MKPNQIGFLLRHSDRISLKKKKNLGLCPLKKLCLEEIRVNVPLTVVQQALQCWEYLICLPIWLCLSPVPMTIEIPGQMVDFDCFSYPEFCESRNQVEARTIDPSHILIYYSCMPLRRDSSNVIHKHSNECPLQTTTSWEELYWKFQFQISKVYHLHVKFSVVKLKIK